MAAILGKKVGMTQVFREDGTVVPVTVVEAGPCKVTAVRKADRDGYKAVQLGFGEVAERKLTKAEMGHLKKADAGALRHLCEFRDEDLGAEGDEGPNVGDDATVGQFEAGQKVKVAGVSKGKGFQGGIKRHNFSRGPVTHGSHNVRAPGSIGASTFPSRVFKGMRMPGQMGNKRVTQKGLEIADVDAERNLLLIKGSVPGGRNAILEIRTDG
jgi:large subunit ribosomal protein L3